MGGPYPRPPARVMSFVSKIRLTTVAGHASNLLEADMAPRGPSWGCRGLSSLSLPSRQPLSALRPPPTSPVPS